MNNLSLYCGLTDWRMSASDTDLPVQCTVVKHSTRKGEINYFVPYEGLNWFYKIPRGAQRCFWVLVVL